MYHFCSYNINMLTKQQNKLFNFLKIKIQKTNISPSFEEMKVAMGLKSKSGIQRLIDGLVERGFIEKKDNKKRAINIVKNIVSKKNNDLISLPLLGNVAAGNPIEAIENTDEKRLGVFHTEYDKDVLIEHDHMNQTIFVYFYFLIFTNIKNILF